MKAEQAYLGTLLKENHLIKDSALSGFHFADGRHQRLFSEMKKLAETGQSVDLVTLAVKTDVLTLGGASYINELTTYANPSKFDEYESLIVDSWKEREKQNILQLAKNEDWNIDKVIKSLDDINEVRANDHTSIKDALAEIYELPWDDRPPKKGVPSGIKRMDHMTNGFQDKEVTIIAARPSMGKTDVMLHIGKQAGWQGYLPIIFSLEMPAERLTERLIASTGGYNRAKLRDPYRMLSAPQKEMWAKTVGRLSDTDIQIFDGAGQSVPEMRAKVRKLISGTNKKPVIIIDYLTLIRPRESHNGNVHQQVTEISKDLKTMAKELSCPVICLAQLSRAVEQRQDKRPMMSDIRESGSVEQDADVIMFLYRDSYYNKESDDDTLEMIIAKNRNGPIGTVLTRYNKHTGEIQDVYN
ncbi:replicative DNA helicase [Siminovitchia fortis]|uniref:DNA 5'-3' helicase n=1 Tax=Siminovitchia fortis TaxID=254758 RepID=A0A443IMP4_9BACI|nr:replicative DNA helicase [Siminovitchia fortis]RWR06719.1 replicative DNA helicase [Siminovitchia fortis]WHY82983.1 replicative DNA helicase [Siminovitchia fortis]